MIDLKDLQKIDFRVGKIISVELIPNAEYSTHKIIIDFGKKIGEKQSCARLVKYTDDELVGRLIVGLINLPPKQIGKNMSEVLILGLPDENEDCALVSPDKDVPLGGKLY